MRIGMMADNYKTHVSGLTNYIALLKDCLVDSGHEVFIFTFDKVGGFDEENRIITTPGLPITDFYLNMQYSQTAKELLYSMDIVHVHHPFASGMLAQSYCPRRKIPIVFTNHTRYDLYTQAYLPALPDNVVKAGLKAYLSRFYKGCNLVIVPSPSMLKVLVEQFGLDTHAVIIPNGIDLQPFSGDIRPIERQTIGFTKEDKVSIYVGRLAPEKNLPSLLKAFQAVAEIDPRARLIMVGDGPERDRLIDQAERLGIRSKVYFAGLVPYHDVPRYLATSDLFVTTSMTEVFPLSIIEAISVGLPVLGINTAGINDIIEDGYTGLLSLDDSEAFLSNYERILNDEKLRQQLGTNARKVSQKYDLRGVTGLIIEQYEQVLESIHHHHHHHQPTAKQAQSI